MLTQPRPGHADLPGMLKYGFDDARDVLERASARETAARVAAGTLAKLLLTHLGVSVVSHIVALGEAATPPDSPRPGPGDLEKVDDERGALLRPGGRGGDDRRREGGGQGRATRSAASPRCSPTACRSGSGSHVHWDRKLDANLAQALM